MRTAGEMCTAGKRGLCGNPNMATVLKSKEVLALPVIALMVALPVSFTAAYVLEGSLPMRFNTHA